MKVQEEMFQLRLPRDGNRSDGIHLSDILRDLAFRTGILDKKWDVPLTDGNSEMAQIGLAWEEYLAKYQHPELQFHPGEMELDGIACSPDALGTVDGDDYADVLGVDVGTWILSEFKASKKSSRKFKEALAAEDKKCLMWLQQIKAYRHVINKVYADAEGAHCNIAKLHVLFINGNYSEYQESKPEYQIYRLHFTDDELESNWRMIVSHRDSILARQKGAQE